MWLIEQSPYWSIVHMSHMIVRRVDTLDDLDWQNHHLDGWNGAVLCCNSSKNSPCPMNILQYHTRRVVPLHRKGINVLVFSNNQTKQIIPSHPFQQIHSLVSLESKAPSPLDFQEKNTTNLSCCEPGLLSSCPRPPSMTLRRAKASRSGRSRCCTCASSRKPQGTTYWRWIKTG